MSIAFDPFNMLSLPVPPQTKEVKFVVKFIPLDIKKPIVEYVFSAGEYIGKMEIVEKIRDH